MKRRILCYGDSNTHGYDLEAGRFDEHTRWPMLLSAKLGDAHTIIEEGLNGRTFIHDDPTEGGHKNGLAYLPACLMSHCPLDLVIIMLGTNDTKDRFNMNACTIAQCAQQMLLTARRYAQTAQGEPARLLLVSPILIADNVSDLVFGGSFSSRSAKISKDFSREYHRMATLSGAAFLDAAKYATPSPKDGIHLTVTGHRALAEALAEKTRSIFE